MLFKSFLVVTALVVSEALAQFCAEAARFGTLKISPNPIVLGQEVTFEASFTCAIELGYAPVYTDYTLVVPASNNTGFQPPIYFARRNAPANGTDSFTHTFDPTYEAFLTYPNAIYEIILDSTSVRQSDSYGDTLTTGGVIIPVTLVQPST